MNTMDIIIRLLEAAALGALIGLEREVVSNKIISDYKNPQVIFGWLRSYTLMALLGAVSVFLGDLLGDTSTMVIFIGSILFLFILFSYAYSAFRQHQFGVTSEFAAVAVFLLGALVMLGEVQVAIFLGIFIAIMLNYKSRVAPLIDKIGENEISTTLKFAVISLIILPLLPDEKYSLVQMLVFLPQNNFTLTPFFNPYGIWFFVVVMSAVSYAGYVLSKMFGSDRGVILSGALGGLVSSTAVTSAMAEKSVTSEKSPYPTVIATVAANSIMFVRVLGIVALFNPVLLGTLLLPIGSMILASAGLLWWIWQKSQEHQTEGIITEKQESPFRIGPALKFSGLVVLIKFFSTFALVYQDSFSALLAQVTQSAPILAGVLQNFPIYLVSLFSGLADVDAITQQMTELSRPSDTLEPLSTLAATTAIIIAVITNTAVKIGLARKFWSKKFGSLVLRLLGTVLLVGVVVLVLISLLG